MGTSYEIISTDGHVLEAPSTWERFLPKRFHDRMPKLVKDPEGGDAVVAQALRAQLPGLGPFRVLGVRADVPRLGRLALERPVQDLAAADAEQFLDLAAGAAGPAQGYGLLT